jgi:hypothetical protein
MTSESEVAHEETISSFESAKNAVRQFIADRKTVGLDTIGVLEVHEATRLPLAIANRILEDLEKEGILQSDDN